MNNMHELMNECVVLENLTKKADKDEKDGNTFIAEKSYVNNLI
jgi:hypothetical protein